MSRPKIIILSRRSHGMMRMHSARHTVRACQQSSNGNALHVWDRRLTARSFSQEPGPHLKPEGISMFGKASVGHFGVAPSGFSDLAGNVWEWTSSPYIPYAGNHERTDGLDMERVQRGGSFLCDQNFCQGFRVTARSHATAETALMHVGFRCAAETGPGSMKGHVLD